MAKKDFKSKSKQQVKAIKANGAKKQAETFPHFRKYKKSGHPALIVGEQVTDVKEEYKFRKVMHDERDGDRLNEEVKPNPNRTDKEPMYIGKRVRHDEKKYFSSWKYPWVYKKKDK